MLSLSERKKKNGTSWQATVRAKGQKSVSKTFDSYEEALAFGVDIDESMRAQARREAQAVPPSLIEEDLGELVKSFMSSKLAKTKHVSHAPTLILQVAGTKVEDVGNRWASDYVEKMRSTKSRHGRPFAYESITAQLTLLSVAIRARADDLDVAPPIFPNFRRYFPHDWSPRRDRRLERDEEMALIRHFRCCGEKGRHMRLLVLFAIETAARLQEMIFADWSEFSFAVDQNGNSRAWWTIPKNHTKTRQSRIVPLSKKAQRILRALRLMQADGMGPFSRMGAPSAVSWQFAYHTKRARIQGFRFHDLRHEGISRLAFQNPDAPLKVMKIVGHTSMKTFSIYVNPRAEDLLNLVK
ncbi:site-specific integrase [Burkholderia glumae]|nr:site-specific integrase [Burkholderia glumae]QHE11528.1 tyrosine-type recombinase/integrase [Burkholderia glumae AU6208]